MEENMKNGGDEHDTEFQFAFHKLNFDSLSNDEVTAIIGHSVEMLRTLFPSHTQPRAEKPKLCFPGLEFKLTR